MKRCFGCSVNLALGDALPCAILVCRECRGAATCPRGKYCRHPDKQHDVLRLAREAMNHHLAEHKDEYRKTNPYWPFLNKHEAWAYQEGK